MSVDPMDEFRKSAEEINRMTKIRKEEGLQSLLNLYEADPAVRGVVIATNNLINALKRVVMEKVPDTTCKSLSGILMTLFTEHSCDNVLNMVFNQVHNAFALQREADRLAQEKK